MRKFLTFSAIGLLALLIVAGAAAFTWAGADAAQTGQPDADAPERPGGTLREIIDPEVMKEAVANALGLTVEEVEAARADGVTLPELAEEQGVEMEDVRAAAEVAKAAMVQEAVEEGLITEAQAERIVNHPGPGGRRGFGKHGPCCRYLREVLDGEVIKEAVADALGLTVEEVEAARADGVTIAELAEEQDVEMEDVRAAAEAAKAEMVQEAVDEGLITEAQAERILSHKGFPCHRGRGIRPGPHGNDAPATAPNPGA